VYRRYYAPLTLYREDIKQIIRLFEKYFEDRELLLDGFSLSSLAEIDHIHKKQLTSFAARGYSPLPGGIAMTDEARQYIQLKLTNRTAVLTVSGNSGPEMNVFVSRIDSFLRRKVDIVRQLLTPGKMFIPIICLNVVFMQLDRQLSHLLFIFVINCIVVALFSGWLYVAYRMRIHRVVMLYLTDVNPVSRFIPDSIEVITFIVLTTILAYFLIAYIK